VPAHCYEYVKKKRDATRESHVKALTGGQLRISDWLQEGRLGEEDTFAFHLAVR
jgi:hypothetical protein